MRESVTRYDKILLLTDLTEKSQPALGLARAFAEYFNSYLCVLHVLPPSEPDGERDGGKVISVRKRLKALATALRADGISVQVRLCRAAVTVQTILRNIRTFRPDLVIQGCGGIDDFRRPFLGSISEEVLRSTDTPVLTVPVNLKLPSLKSLRFDRILLATDFGAAVRTASFHALSLAQEFGARVYLCHVQNGDSIWKWSEDDMSTLFRNELDRLVGLSVTELCHPKSLVAFGKPSETILKFAHSEKCDLIVLGAHALGPLGSRGKPGTVFRVISGANCPVLTIASAKRDDDANHDAEQTELIGA